MIENYLKELLKIKHDNTQKFPPSPAHIHELQAQLGFTTDDKDRLEELFEGFLMRGKGFGKYTQWQKAIHELTQASQLKPWDKEVNFLLADAHCHAFLKNGNPIHKKNALYYADISLKIAPNNELAIQVIDKVERRKVSFWQKKNFLVLVSVFLGVMLLFWIFSDNTQNDKRAKETINFVEKVKIIDKTSYKKDNIRISWTNGNIQGKWITEKSLCEKISPEKISPEKTNIENTDIKTSQTEKISQKQPESYEYQLAGTWQCLENQNLTHLHAEINLFDEKGEPIKQESWEILNDSLAEMWKGDAIPVVRTWKNLKKAVKKVKIQLLTWEYEAENTQNTTKNINLANSFIEFALDCKERHQLILPNAENFNQTITFSIKNNSNIPIQELKIKIQWLYKNNTLAHEQIFEAQNQFNPTWQTNETRVFKQSFNIPIALSDYKGYKMEVLEIE